MVKDSCSREIKIGSYICYATGDKNLDFGKALDIEERKYGGKVKVQGINITNYNGVQKVTLKGRTGDLLYPSKKIMVIPPELLPEGALELLIDL